MADQKISALTVATTPLAGTEVLPIVQSSTTKQVSVANLTAARSVAFSKGTATTAGKGSFVGLDSTAFAAGVGASVDLGGTYRALGDTIAFTRMAAEKLNATDGNISYNISFYTTNDAVGTLSTKPLTLGYAGDVTVNVGNLVPKTAGKGVNFTANTPAAGMTSQLLNWYEEGTWTPTQGAGLTVVGAFSSTGRYTRIGRQVTVSGTVTGATSVAVTAAGIITTNLPFTVVTAGHGNATNAAVNASAAVICTTTNVTSASAIAATGTITFSATYFV